MNYYNENNPFAVEFLKILISENVISKGEVDDRDIRDIKPSELAGYKQCHFFAGIGVWSYALRLAGWPEDREVWTGSCPCQPFSQAGQGKGTSDERHLWPSWFHLIQQRKPPVIFGEQVEAAVKHGWLDLVSDDLEASGYSIGAVPFPACSVGAPHIRQRIYFAANSQRTKLSGSEPETGWFIRHSEFGQLANSRSLEFGRLPNIGRQETVETGRTSQAIVVGVAHDEGPQGLLFGRNSSDKRVAGKTSLVNELADTERGAAERYGHNLDGATGEIKTGEEERQRIWSYIRDGIPTDFWGNAEWVWCRDEKYRPVESGTFPLAHGVANRVQQLRCYGNAIVAPQAQIFIESFMDFERERENAPL